MIIVNFRILHKTYYTKHTNTLASKQSNYRDIGFQLLHSLSNTAHYNIHTHVLITPKPHLSS